MNKQMQQFARDTLKAGLAQLPESKQIIFKLMYARDNGKRTIEVACQMSINDAVDDMPPDKLDWAMQQVENSLAVQAEKQA